MSTTVLKRAAVGCYDCGKAHQLRLVDRGPSWEGPGQREAVYSGRNKIEMPGAVDQHELFDLAVALVREFSEGQTVCPLTNTRRPRKPQR